MELSAEPDCTINYTSAYGKAENNHGIGVFFSQDGGDAKNYQKGNRDGAVKTTEKKCGPVLILILIPVIDSF